MISGFNTDIEFEGTVYHVQTEDKGQSARMIMSLVYDRGTILASKRVSYEDIAAGDFDEKALAERVGRQHKLICAAVSAGRIDELREMTAKSAAKVAKAKSKAEAVPVLAKAKSKAEAVSVLAETMPILDVGPEEPAADEPIVMPADVLEMNGHVNVLEDEEIFPADAVEVVSELSGLERPSNTKLSLELLGEPKFKGGEQTMVNVMICRGTARKVVPDAQIMVKVLGSSFRPVIFHAKTDSNGLAQVHLDLPHFQAGRAALLVRAITGGEEVELRRMVASG